MASQSIKIALFSALVILIVFAVNAERVNYQHQPASIELAKATPTWKMSPKMSPKTLVTQTKVIGDTLVTPKMSPMIGDNPSVSPKMSPIPISTPIATAIPTNTPPISPLPSPQETDQPYIGSNGGVSINEIAWMGTNASATDEWIELYNFGDMDISVEGWTLNSVTGSSPDPKIILTGTIPSHGYALLERTSDTTVSDMVMFMKYPGALNDSGEALELRDNAGILKDSVPANGGWFAGDKNTRSSMERIDPFLSGDQANNWATNNGLAKNGKDAVGNPINGTPGAKNSMISY